MSPTSSLVPSNIATIGSPETKRSDPLGGGKGSTTGQGTTESTGQGTSGKATSVEGQPAQGMEPDNQKADKN